MRIFCLLICFLVAGCAQDPYRLKISNNLGDAHGKSVYFRSNLRSSYAGQIRRVLSRSFGQMGIKTATDAASADYIAIFDIETFYRQDGAYKNNDYAIAENDTALFTTEEEGTSLGYSGNANMQVDKDKTCFTLNIGRKETSKAIYSSSFCADTIYEVEDFLPQILDIYTKYATYSSADIGVQCHVNNRDETGCNVVHDRQQAFIDSLWIDNRIDDAEEEDSQF